MQTAMIPAPTDRQTWLAERRKRIGATDVSAILGKNPYKTAYEVWLDKMGLLEEWEGNEATELGNLFEPVILDEAERRWGKLERQMVVHDSLSPIGATLDGWLPDRREVVEVKTAGLTNEFAELGHWGEEYTDEIPLWYAFQLQVQMMCTGSEVGRMLAMISGRGFIEYQLGPDHNAWKDMRDRCNHWWEKHVIGRVEPKRDVLPSIEILKRVKRQPNSVMTFKAPAMSLVQEWENAKADESAARKRTDAAQAALLVELGTNEAAMLPDGKMLTYLETERKGYEVKPCKYRTLRIKKGK